MNELQDFGVMTEEYTEDMLKYNARILSEFCDERGKRLSELSKNELKQALEQAIERKEK